MASVVMYKNNSNNTLVLASLAEKQAEYDSIKKQPYGFSRNANFYKLHTTLIMKDHDIVAQKEKHILKFYSELTKYYTTSNGFAKSFDLMPYSVQKALLDMVFNLGITKLRTQYVKMNNAIKKEDWIVAAVESKGLEFQVQETTMSATYSFLPKNSQSHLKRLKACLSNYYV